MRAALIFAAFGAFIAYAPPAWAQPVPSAAIPYQRDLIRTARASGWGLTAPIDTFASQIHQESGWNPNARSAYAGGLAQFTPDSAAWIAGAYLKDAGAAQPFNPAWAMRALVTYDYLLYQEFPAVTPCDQWAFALSAYNGGAGWVDRDKRLAAAHGADASRWWGNVELYSQRSAAAITENRSYPKRILLQIQPIYALWGAGVDCGGIHVVAGIQGR